MAFKVKSGKVKTIWMPVTPSTAIARGTLVAFTSGKLVAATSATTTLFIEGILDKAIVSTDADYALDRKVPVVVPLEKFVVYEADVTSGLVAADIGLEQDLTDGATVNRAASAVDVCKCIQVISTTKGLFLVKVGGAY